MIQAIVTLLEIILIGRLLLSFLPPGEVGSHRLRDLPVTIAASYALGQCAWLGFEAWCARIGVWPKAWMNYIALAALLGLRLATLPGAIAPPREREHQGTTPLAVLVVLAAFAVLVWKITTTFGNDLQYLVPEYIGLLASLTATGVLFGHGLRSARRDPISRAIAWTVAIALVFAPYSTASPAWEMAKQVELVAGLSFAVAWWRLGDRRALALAALSFASTSIFVAIGSLLTLVVATARPSRFRAFAIAATALAALHAEWVFWNFGSGAVFVNVELLGDSWLDLFRFDAYPMGWICLAAILIATAIGLARRLSSPERTLGTIDSPRREAIASLALALAVFAIEYFDKGSGVHPSSEPLSYSLPAGTVLIAPFAAALVFGRAEKVAPRSAS